MLQFYLILRFENFELLREDWIKKLPNLMIRIIAVHCVCNVLDFEFNLQVTSKTLPITTVRDRWELTK